MFQGRGISARCPILRIGRALRRTCPADEKVVPRFPLACSCNRACRFLVGAGDRLDGIPTGCLWPTLRVPIAYVNCPEGLARGWTRADMQRVARQVRTRCGRSPTEPPPPTEGLAETPETYRSAVAAGQRPAPSARPPGAGCLSSCARSVAAWTLSRRVAPGRSARLDHPLEKPHGGHRTLGARWQEEDGEGASSAEAVEPPGRARWRRDVGEGRADQVVSIERQADGDLIATWQDGGVPVVMRYTPPSVTGLADFPVPPESMVDNPASLLTALRDASETAEPASIRFALDHLELCGDSGTISATDSRQVLVRCGRSPTEPPPPTEGLQEARET